MPATLDDLEQFHQFAREQIRSGARVLELSELVSRWHAEKERAEIKAIIDRGIADIQAGNLGRDAFEVTEELARKHGIIP